MRPTQPFTHLELQLKAHKQTRQPTHTIPRFTITPSLSQQKTITPAQISAWCRNSCTPPLLSLSPSVVFARRSSPWCDPNEWAHSSLRHAFVNVPQSSKKWPNRRTVVRREHREHPLTLQPEWRKQCLLERWQIVKLQKGIYRLWNNNHTTFHHDLATTLNMVVVGFRFPSKSLSRATAAPNKLQSYTNTARAPRRRRRPRANWSSQFGWSAV